MCCFSRLTQALLAGKPGHSRDVICISRIRGKAKKKKKVGVISEYFKQLILMETSHAEDTSQMGGGLRRCVCGAITLSREESSVRNAETRTLCSFLSLVHP